MVPADVFDDLRMGLKSVQRINCGTKLVWLIDIPEANAVVITT